MRLLFGVLALLVLSSGSACGTSLSYIQTSPRPPGMHTRSGDQVAVLMTGKPDRPYKEIGIIESQQESIWSEDTKTSIIAQMREYAGYYGCDAIVIFTGNDATVVTGGQGYTSSHTLIGYRASCIVYTAPAQALQQVQPVQPTPPPLAANSCIPNSTQLCDGPGACRGAQSCNADGKSYTPCDCGPKAAPAASPQVSLQPY